jgi:hypothetical protein
MSNHAAFIEQFTNQRRKKVMPVSIHTVPQPTMQWIQWESCVLVFINNQ